jgi:hypothetical protein
MEQSQLHTTLSDPEFHRQSRDRIAAAIERLDAVTKELAACYERWEALASR